MLSTKLAAVAVLAALVVSAGEARADTSVLVNGTELRVSAAAQHANRVVVFESGLNVVVRDIGDAVRAGAGCSSVATDTASCPKSSVNGLIVALGDLDDVIDKATTLDAVLSGGVGNDTLRGGRGADILRGGPGADWLSGGPDRDQADYTTHAGPVTVTLDTLADDGEAGEGDYVGQDIEDITGTRRDDLLIGNNAPNKLDGRAGDDDLRGLGADDVFPTTRRDGADDYIGGSGVDHVNYATREAPVQVDIDGIADDGEAGEGDNVTYGIDKVTGGESDDLLLGSAFDEILLGGGGSDDLAGMQGDDRILGGEGGDTLDGGRDDDVLEGGAGADWFSGGDGRDRADYTWSPAVKVSIDGVANDGTPGEGDDVSMDVEDVTGSLLADTLIGNGSGNELIGLGGDDNLLGLGGPDRLVGGGDADLLLGGFGDELDGVDQVAGNDRLFGDGDTDTCASDAGDTEITCEA